MSGLTRFLPVLVGLLLILSVAPVPIAWSHGDPDEIIERRDDPPNVPPILPPPTPPGNGLRGVPPPESDVPEPTSGSASAPVIGGAIEFFRLLWTIASQAL